MDIRIKMKELSDYMKLDIAQDKYEGVNDSYLVFFYEDERAGLRADDKTILDTAFFIVKVIVPKYGEYNDKKEQVRDWLEENDILVTSMTQFVEHDVSKRHLIFNCEMSEQR